MLLLAKGPVAASNSWHAQGGVAAALGDDDSPALHAEDTLRAGRGLCRESAVRVLTEEAPARIADLVEAGVEFDDEPRPRRRALACAASSHAGGAETGKAIAAGARRARPRAPADHARRGRARRLALGGATAAAPACSPTAARSPRRATLLATGGYAALWERTTNPPGALGEGLALAYRAGAALADLEFVQFHPTALVDDGFLLSEALRGEGALLVDDERRAASPTSSRRATWSRARSPSAARPGSTCGRSSAGASRA